MIVLTPQERDRFATWLEQEAASYDALAKQAETLTFNVPTAKMLKLQAVGCAIVARKLRTTEEQTMGEAAMSMRPIARGDLIVTADDYYALVLEVSPECIVVQLSNGLKEAMDPATVHRLGLKGQDGGEGSPASFAESVSRPATPRDRTAQGRDSLLNLLVEPYSPSGWRALLQWRPEGYDPGRYLGTGTRGYWFESYDQAVAAVLAAAGISGLVVEHERETDDG